MEVPVSAQDVLLSTAVMVSIQPFLLSVGNLLSQPMPGLQPQPASSSPLAGLQGMQILVHKGGQQAGVQQFTSLVDTAVYTR